MFPVRVSRGAIQIDADAVPPLPEGHDAGYLDRWARRHDTREPTYEYLNGLVNGPPISAMRSNKELRPSWDDVLLVPGQLARPPRLAAELLALRTRTGKRAARPLELEVPFFVSHMSFGALSVSAKTALARVAGELGTAIGSGEGGLLDEEREHCDRVIFEMASGYFGWRPENIRKADAIEIKIGQSAKAGSGGLLPSSKVTGRIAEVRGLQPGQDAHSPARFPDIHSAADLRARVDDIRELIDGRPIGIKLAAGRVEEDLDVAIEAGADFVTIDGHGGGTGAAPDVLKDNLTVPIQYALHRARAHLAGARRRRPRHRGRGLLPDRGGRHEGDRDGRDRGRDGDGLDDRDWLPAVPRLPHRQLPGRHRDAAAGPRGAPRRRPVDGARRGDAARVPRRDRAAVPRGRCGRRPRPEDGGPRHARLGAGRAHRDPARLRRRRRIDGARSGAGP